MRTGLLVVMLALAPRTALADTDARWLPWIGCWQSSNERAVNPEARVCYVPLPSGEVERIVVTVDDPSAPSRAAQPLVADGAEHPLVHPECTGLMRVDWSADGHRYFTTSERSCIDEVAARTSSISLLLPGPAWIDAEVVETSGRETVQVHRYRRVAVPASLAPRLPADLVARADAAADSLSVSRLTVTQLIDASSRVNSHALEAVVLESNTPFLLTVAGLKALSKARVDENVIDLMIAVSYPEHFAIDQPSSSNAGGSAAWSGGIYGTMWDCYYPYFDPVFCYTSASFLYAYETPYHAPPSVIVGPTPPIAPGIPVLPSGQARAVNGQGYTRVRESDSATASSSTNASRSSNTSRPSSTPSARAHSASSGSSSGSSSSGGGSSSSSSSSSSSGSSSGGSSGGGGYSSGGGGSTGRTAVPR